MTNIQAAADMIAEFSPATAAAFLSQPFRRSAIAEAFDAGFRTHTAYTLKVCAFVALAAKADRINRAVAAASQ